jgi:GNAT superfamily N-acetyltransferase
MGGSGGVLTPPTTVEDMGPRLRVREVCGLDDPWMPGVLDIWQASFPAEDQAPLSWWVRLMRDQAAGIGAHRHLLAAATDADGGEKPACMAYYELRRGAHGPDGPPAGYLVYLATSPDRRADGLGTAMYREVMRRMHGAGCRTVSFEVEIPEVVTRRASPAAGEWARRRLAWYRRNGARLLGGVYAAAGIGGPQPDPEAVMVHPHPELPYPTPEEGFYWARAGIGASALRRTECPLSLI